MMSDNLTLFDMDVLTPQPSEPLIERYVVVITDVEDGKSCYRRNKRQKDDNSSDKRHILGEFSLPGGFVRQP
jgi:hypothetical protein